MAGNTSVITLEIRIDDKGSPQVRALSGDLDKLGGKGKSAGESLAKGGASGAAGLDKAAKSGGRLKGSLGEIDREARRTANSLTTRLGPAGRVVAALGPAGLAAAAGIGAYVTAAIAGTKRAAEWETAMLRTEALVRSTGGAAGYTAAELGKLAKEMDLATLGSKKGAIEAINVLQTFKSVSGETFRETVILAHDLAAVMGTDARSAALQLGKALEEPDVGLNALRRSGVSFTEQQKELIKTLVETGRQAEAQRLILEALQGQVGGAGAAQAGGLAGSVDTLHFHWGEFLESLEETETAKGAVDLLADTFKGLTGFVRELKGETKDGIPLRLTIKLTENVDLNLARMLMGSIPGIGQSYWSSVVTTSQSQGSSYRGTVSDEVKKSPLFAEFKRIVEENRAAVEGFYDETDKRQRGSVKLSKEESAAIKEIQKAQSDRFTSEQQLRLELAGLQGSQFDVERAQLAQRDEMYRQLFQGRHDLLALWVQVYQASLDKIAAAEKVHTYNLAIEEAKRAKARADERAAVVQSVSEMTRQVIADNQAATDETEQATASSLDEQVQYWDESYDEIGSIVERFSRDAQKTVGDFLRHFRKTGEAEFDDLADYLLDSADSLLTDLAIIFAREGLVIPIIGQFMGAMGMPTGMGMGGMPGMASGGVMGSLFSGSSMGGGSGISSLLGSGWGASTSISSSLFGSSYAGVSGISSATSYAAPFADAANSSSYLQNIPNASYLSAGLSAINAITSFASGDTYGGIYDTLTAAANFIPVYGQIISGVMALAKPFASGIWADHDVPHTLSANMLLGGFSQPGSPDYDVYRDPSLWIDNPNNVTAGALGSGFEFMIAAGRYGQDFGTAAQGKQLANALEDYFDNWFTSLEDTLGDGVVNAILKADPMAFTIDDLEEGMSFEDLAGQMTDQVVQQYGSAFADALLDAKVGEGTDFSQAFRLDPEALYALRHGEGTQEDLETLINQYNQAAALWDELDILKGGRQTSGFQAAIDSTNAQFDALIDTMEDLGFTAAAIADVEAERTEYLERQTAAARENFDQTLGLRQMALQGGTDVSMYLAKQNYLGGQETELLGGIQQWVGLDQATTDQVGAYFDAMASGDRGTASGIFAELSASFATFGEDGDRVVQLMQLLRDEFDLYSQSLERQREAMRNQFDEDLGIRWLAATGQTGQAEKLSFLSGQKSEAMGAASTLLGADFQGLAGIEDHLSNYFAAIGEGNQGKAESIFGWLTDTFGDLGEDGARLTELLGVLGNEFQNYTDEVNAQIEAEKRAWEMASEDLEIRKLRAQGLDDEAAAMEFQLAQERELEQARLDGADASYLAELAATQAAEANKYAADVAEAAAEAAQAEAEAAQKEAQAKKEASEDLNVRLLRAQGLDMEAEALAFSYQQQRELNEAIQNHATYAELDKLATIQAAEALAFHKQQAETYTQFHTDLLVRYYQATGQAMLADLTSFSWSAYQLIEEAKGMGYDLGFVTEVLAEERLALLAGYEDEADAANAAATATSNYASQLESARKSADQTILSLKTNIQGWMDAFEQGNLTVLNPQDQLTEAAFDFERQYALAKGGDQAALQSITQYADRYLQAGRDMYASSMGYQDIYSGVMGLMEQLPEQVDYQALILQAINNANTGISGAVSTGTGSTTSAVDSLREEFQTQFSEIDANLSGGITPEEWRAYFDGNTPAQEEVAELLGKPDMFAGGKLEDIETAFGLIDLNSDGIIDSNELIAGGVSDLKQPTQNTAAALYDSFGGSMAVKMSHIYNSLAGESGVQRAVNAIASALDATGYAEGGYPEGWSWVGERGRELMYIGQPARIWSNEQSEAMLRAANAPMQFDLNLDRITCYDSAVHQAVLAVVEEQRSMTREFRSLRTDIRDVLAELAAQPKRQRWASEQRAQ